MLWPLWLVQCPPSLTVKGLLVVRQREGTLFDHRSRSWSTSHLLLGTVHLTFGHCLKTFLLPHRPFLEMLDFGQGPPPQGVEKIAFTYFVVLLPSFVFNRQLHVPSAALPIRGGKTALLEATLKTQSSPLKVGGTRNFVRKSFQC